MTPERWAQVEELFHRATECEARNRAALLDQACHDDPELRREVEALLQGDQGVTDDLQVAVQNHLGTVGFPLIGETISHYRILGGLGGGGMGLVYVAEDLKLGRSVALKFLPEEAARNPEALKRFEREARSASALEHSNICPIYEFGEHEGQPFLVMQLLEGQTLRELISAAGPRKPPLPLDKLLDLAVQVASGLEAAHGRGIIHRDIKPANIFVTNQGQAKILDFGLAKLAGASSTVEDLQTNPSSEGAGGNSSPEGQMRQTPDPFLSRTGMAMGTAGYMSPEQARGEKLDARTDLFSFGLVLYEMATGQRAFKGDTGPLLHDAILKHEPTAARLVNPQLPPRLEEIIGKALEKDREARYQSVLVMRADLQNLREKSEHRSRWSKWAAGTVAVLLIMSTIFWLFERRRLSSQTPREPKLRQLTVNSFENPVTGGAISPDGKYLAYTDNNGMYVKIIETGETRVVPQPEGFKSKDVDWEVLPSGWFPDRTRFIANAHSSEQDPSLSGSKNTSIWMVSMLGGLPQKLRDHAVAWSVSPNGSSIVLGTNKDRFGEREVWLMVPTGELQRKILEADEKSAVNGFLWAPDGQRAIYVKTDESGDSLMSFDLGGRPSTIVFSPAELKSIEDISWLPDGRLLYSQREPGSLSECNYWTSKVNPRTGQRVDKPQQLTNWTDSCGRNLSVTADGKRLAFLKWAPHLTSYIADLAAGGTRIVNLRHFPLTESSDAITSWTSDGKEVTLVSNRTGRYGIYRQSLDADTADGPLVTPPDGTRNARATPDGKWILYFGEGKNKDLGLEQPEPVMRAPIDGGPSQPLFTAATRSIFACSLSRSAGCAIAEPSEDRKQLIVTALDPLKGRGSELMRFPLDPSDNDRVWSYGDDIMEGVGYDLSADGTNIAVTRTPAGPIYVFSVLGQPVQQINVKGWSNLKVLELTWSADGKGLFVVTVIRGGHVLLYVNLQGSAHVVWKSAGGSIDTMAHPSPDGRRLAIETWTTSGNMWMLENF